MPDQYNWQLVSTYLLNYLFKKTKYCDIIMKIKSSI